MTVPPAIERAPAPAIEAAPAPSAAPFLADHDYFKYPGNYAYKHRNNLSIIQREKKYNSEIFFVK